MGTSGGAFCVRKRTASNSGMGPSVTGVTSLPTDTTLGDVRALGATLGQGWLFGRPAPGPSVGQRTAAIDLPAPQPVRAGDDELSPFQCLPTTAPLRRAPKALLIELSKQLERQAMRLGDTCVVAATFQEARHFTPALYSSNSLYSPVSIHRSDSRYSMS